MSKRPHQLCMGITGKVKIRVTPDDQAPQTYIYARAKRGRGSFAGPDGQEYTLRRSYNRVDNPSLEQLQGRARMAAANQQWQALPTAQRNIYRERSRSLGMTGYNLFVKEFCQAHPLSEF